MQNKPNIAIDPVMLKQTHHQRGAGCSTTPEMRSVIQLKLRLFNTSGARLIRDSAADAASLSITSVGASFISWPRSTSSRLLPRTGDANVVCVRHFRIWIADPPQITRARFHVQIIEQP